ncbi:hypothetical protein [uncultured Enterovirga sp.]|uniref:hypothetical protein n=1 Tax=uncultured Enterovirga sp. TaxID=2026352 RepID=UPI0035CA65D5
MSTSKRANLGIAALSILVLVVAFVGYRYTQYGRAEAPAPGQPANVDQKPPEAYKPRPQ